MNNLKNIFPIESYVKMLSCYDSHLGFPINKKKKKNNQKQYLIRKSFREQFHHTCGLREEDLISANQNHNWLSIHVDFLNEMKIIKKNIRDLPNNISAKFAIICPCSHLENKIEMLKARTEVDDDLEMDTK